jgi:hypothetical protein
MNIKLRLGEEHSKNLTLAIVNFIGQDKKRFKELMTVFFGGDHRLTQRAAWPFSFVAIAHPELLKPYFGKLVAKLKEGDAHPAIARNILRTFQEVDVPEKFQGELVDICFKCIMSEMKPIAIRAFAMSVAARICKHYPELKNELLLILKDLALLPQTPAIKVRIKSALKQLRTVDSKI